MRYIVLDLETTGLSPSQDRIIEIAAVSFDMEPGSAVPEVFEPAACFQTLVNPHMPVSKRITDMTGISEAMLSDQPCTREALVRLDEFLGKDYVLMGHNISFDYAFLKESFFREKQLEAVNWSNAGVQAVDTLAIAKKLHPEFESKALSALTRHYSISHQNAHRAMADVLATIRLYAVFCEEVKRLGTPKAADMLAPHYLSYGIKKNTPITLRQKGYLRSLVIKHRIPADMLRDLAEGEGKPAEEDWKRIDAAAQLLQTDVEAYEKIFDKMSKSKASCLIDGILSHF